MDFQKLLLQVGQALSREEIQAVAFLCTDLLGRDLSSFESASDLFSLLADQDFLSAERPYLLADLLSTIQRHRLVRELGLNGQISSIRSLIPPFRKLLYDVSDDITKEDLRKIKFLLRDSLPRKKLEENVTTLEVFQEMEHKDLLSNTNLNLLENIIENVCPMLKRRIDQFKTEKVTHTGPVTQETGAGLYRQRSASGPDVLKPNKPGTSIRERPASCGLPSGLDECANPGEYLMPPSFFLMQPSAEYVSMNPSNISLDATRVSDNTDEGLSHRMSLLSTKPSTSAAPREKSHNVKTLSSSESMTFGPLQFQTRNTKEEVLGTYAVIGTQRGVCLIVNNHDFTDSTKQLNNRDGTHVDEESLESVFKWLGFDVQIERDCTRDRMLSVVQELRQRDHSLMDCLVCCVLSHGQEGSVYGVDGQLVQLKELTEPFNGLQCASLMEKPKLFFIQACQGAREQQAVQIQADSPALGSLCTDARVPKDSIPSDADFLMGMATVPHFASFRDRKLGTWFIQSLVQNLVKMVPCGYDLVSILTKVNDDVSKKTDSNGERKQMPQPALTLRKRVVFPIPKDPPPSLI